MPEKCVGFVLSVVCVFVCLCVLLDSSKECFFLVWRLSRISLCNDLLVTCDEKDQKKKMIDCEFIHANERTRVVFVFFGAAFFLVGA